MKTFITTLFLVSSLFGFATDKWLHDYDKALSLAQKEQKNIYLFVGADKCHFCKRFKETTLSQKKVIKKLRQNYILLYLSRDRHFIPKKFQRFGVPRHYFLDSEGKILFESFGVLEPAGFFTLLDEADLNADN
ncbi:thioredoxin family protein [Sulfurimonas sp. SWIR-19]|uniref:thioredoxin family protein n=1 Tax=Sulfurimonas sp. SWIR-19 TaxID=2878390 RepID=UPI001CF48649|nr:thioredoxin family protein [Sulfurimonas sp. SWIR-19]UCM99986.1 thioredoxin family protein [Sulfurimonas sp. SWIR-19]